MKEKFDHKIINDIYLNNTIQIPLLEQCKNCPDRCISFSEKDKTIKFKYKGNWIEIFKIED